MQSTGAKIAVAVGVVAVIVVGFVALQSDDKKKSDSATRQTTSTPTGGKTKPVSTTKTVVLKNGKPVGGIAKLNFNKGEQVTFIVKPDVDGEIHIHGYNIEKPGVAGKPVKISFPG